MLKLRTTEKPIARLFAILTLVSLTLLSAFSQLPSYAKNNNFRLDRSDRGRRTIFFATTRLNEGSSRTPNYGGQRHLDFGNGSIDYGSAQIKRPSGLIRMEKAGTWSTYLDGMKENDTKWQETTVSGIKCLDEGDMFSALREWTGPICIFVHGYDESLESAMKDAAIVAFEFDRRNTSDKQLLPILFSWPSADRLHQYSKDETNAEWSATAFAQLIDKIHSVRSSDSSLYLVAHSLGSRLALSLLNQKDLVERKPFDKLILSAPDCDFFQSLRQIDNLQTLVKDHIFVFVSDRDGPLTVSQLLHGSPRLGRPFDPPQISKQASAYASMEGWERLLDQVADIMLPGGLNNPKEAAIWLSRNSTVAKELGERTRFVDVSELVSRDLGHRIAWPVVASLLEGDDCLFPLATTLVYKRPDMETLRQNNGVPPVIYRFHRISGQFYGQQGTPDSLR
ncbi:MAG: alpha/beta hydrolase [Cyanobacteria bacterium]|nr:alpha/beta hydrolase [Cyanobacteriota bacterium]